MKLLLSSLACHTFLKFSTQSWRFPTNFEDGRVKELVFFLSSSSFLFLGTALTAPLLVEFPTFLEGIEFGRGWESELELGLWLELGFSSVPPVNNLSDPPWAVEGYPGNLKSKGNKK